MPTLFTQIIAREIPANILYETETVIAFRDIHPLAKTHILICLKREIPNIQSIGEEDLPLLSEIFRVARELAKSEGIEEGYRLVTNCGPSAGQTIFHLHFHLIGGSTLGGMA